MLRLNLFYFDADPGANSGADPGPYPGLGSALKKTDPEHNFFQFLLLLCLLIFMPKPFRDKEILNYV